MYVARNGGQRRTRHGFPFVLRLTLLLFLSVKSVPPPPPPPVVVVVMAKKPFSYAKLDNRVKNLRSNLTHRKEYNKILAANKAREKALARQIMAGAGNALMHVASQGSSTAGRVRRRKGGGRRLHKHPTLKRNKRGQFVKRRR